MAQPTTASASKLSIWIGNSASPGIYVAPCGLNTRGINFSATVNDVTVPDCDDPDLPAWTQRTVQALSAGINGSGVLALESLPTWQSFYFGAVSLMCRVLIDHADGYRFDGLFLLTTFNITGQIGNKIQVEVGMQSDGEVVATAVP